MYTKNELIEDIMACIEYDLRDEGADEVAVRSLLHSKSHDEVLKIYNKLYSGDYDLSELL